MNPINSHICNFILKQTCASICCVDENNLPYCFSCFYAYEKEKNLLYYKTTANTNHSVLLENNPVVAGTILPDKFSFLKIKGIQFEGVLLSEDDPLSLDASAHYYKKHPMALTLPGKIWTIQINSIKFTDNTLGFGTKLKWKRTTTSAKNLSINKK